MAKSIQHNVAYVACGSGCASAGGDARCSEGCIGCGACVTACPHGAIALIDGIARVDRSKCTGCGLCGMACPQRVIAFVPGYQNILVRCNNTDKGAIARKICDTSCIGCGMCAKNALPALSASRTTVPISTARTACRAACAPSSARMAPFTTAPASPPACRRESPWHRNSLYR